LSGRDTLSVIDPSTNAVTPVDLGSNFEAEGLTADPRGKEAGTVYAIEEGTGTVLELPAGG
jgi:hypothetical protein